MIGVQSYAQLLEKAEDISSLLIGEIIPDMELKAPDASIDKVSIIFGEKPQFYWFNMVASVPFCNTHLSEI